MTWLLEQPSVWVLLALAAYGLFAAVGQFFDRLARLNEPRSPDLLVVVRNSEAEIEGIARDLCKTNSRVTFVDWASSDQTPVVLDRLARIEAGLAVIQLSDAQATSHGLGTLVGDLAPVVLVMDLRRETDMRTVLKEYGLSWK